jgi:hypothetical protein
MLMFSCVEKESEEDVYDNFQKLNGWLTSHHFGPLVQVEDQVGGSRYPQCIMACGGYNHFLEDEFVAEFRDLMWNYPENAVLVIQPEDGPTRVWRGDVPIESASPVA